MCMHRWVIHVYWHITSHIGEKNCISSTAYMFKKLPRLGAPYAKITFVVVLEHPSPFNTFWWNSGEHDSK